jgi:hypothetical protein
VNVDADPAAGAELGRLGVPLVPAVVHGDRAVHGWNPAGYAALLGVDYRVTERLAPADLAGRLDRVLAAAEALVRMLGEAELRARPPERDRSVGDLAYHVFRLSLAFVDGVDRGHFPESWLQETPSPTLDGGPALASYGALVRARLAGWFEGAGPDDYRRVIETYYGPQTGHELLERTTWHAAQHLRQLYALAHRLGVTPPAPLPTDAFEGLPLPAALW